jgi:hypothetical protein
MWALSYFSDADAKYSSLILNNINLKVILDSILNPNLKIKVPALRVIGCILASDEKDVEEVLDCGGLEVLKKLITDPSTESSILKEACWAISNVTASSHKHIEQVLDCGLIRILCDIVGNLNLNYSVKLFFYILG